MALQNKVDVVKNKILEEIRMLNHNLFCLNLKLIYPSNQINY